MIQRIQTVYLLISLILWSLLFLNPLFGFQDATGTSWDLLWNGLKEVQGGKVVMETVPLMVWFMVVELLLLVSIFLFSKREFQSRITLLAAILQVLSYAVIIYYLIEAKGLVNAKPELTIWTIFPIASAVFSYLALRGIRSDISMLRAQDRIR